MSFLEQILKEKESFLEERKKLIPKNAIIDKIVFPLSQPQFKKRLKQKGIHLIAEIKRASPSKGDLRPNCDILEIAQIYESKGVGLVSILTEEKFFKGNIEDMEKIKACTSLAILRKDFIIDDYQVLEAKVYGADAILLIVSILDKVKLKELISLAKNINLDIILEVHTEAELKIALDYNVEIIGINNRNLEDFSIDKGLAARLVLHIPEDKIIIVESGIQTDEDLGKVKNLGVNGVLVGEALMRAENIEKKVSDFLSVLNK